MNTENLPDWEWNNPASEIESFYVHDEQTTQLYYWLLEKIIRYGRPDSRAMRTITMPPFRASLHTQRIWCLAGTVSVVPSVLVRDHPDRRLYFKAAICDGTVYRTNRQDNDAFAFWFGTFRSLMSRPYAYNGRFGRYSKTIYSGPHYPVVPAR
jgi:hypothetical protein